MYTIRPSVRSAALGPALLTGVPTGLSRASRKTLCVLALAGRHGKNA